MRDGRHLGPPNDGRWKFASDDAVAAQRVQHGIVSQLERDGASGDDTMTAQVILSELLGNIVRHAPGVVEVILTCESGRPVLHVLDRGAGFTFAPCLPSDPFAESGRGLFMVRALAADFTILPRIHGGSHAIATLHPIERRLERTLDVAIGG